VSLCAIVLASLFSERRESEARLARSNLMLQRERNNRLMNIDAITSAIVHEVRQPLLNLIRNAIDAIDAMDSITDRARVLRVKTEHDGREAIVVSVEDSGSGIDPQTLHSIFDAFVTTKPEGMGLGLAICRMIISRHEGQLSASADNKSGALFKFTLPIKSAVSPRTLARFAAQ
jgi:C4-dicarboxylate-specific signal transduction histidine kinase